MSSDFLEKIKTHDISLGGTLIMLTGRGHILEHKHGVCLETEEKYGEITLDDGKILKLYSDSEEGLIYSNYILISIGALTRQGNSIFVERKRPKGFVSKTTAGLDKEIDLLVDEFQEKYSDYLKNKELRFYDTDGGITISSPKDDGDLFDLKSPKVVEEYEVEVVKRIAIPYTILKQLISSEARTESFFKGIDKDMNDIGCKYYTFKYPDGNYYLRRSSEASRNIELRACGKAKEIK